IKSYVVFLGSIKEPRPAEGNFIRIAAVVHDGNVALLGIFDSLFVGPQPGSEIEALSAARLSMIKAACPSLFFEILNMKIWLAAKCLDSLLKYGPGLLLVGLGLTAGRARRRLLGSKADGEEN